MKKAGIIAGVVFFILAAFILTLFPFRLTYFLMLAFGISLVVSVSAVTSSAGRCFGSEIIKGVDDTVGVTVGATVEAAGLDVGTAVGLAVGTDVGLAVGLKATVGVGVSLTVSGTYESVLLPATYFMHSPSIYISVTAPDITLTELLFS